MLQPSPTRGGGRRKAVLAGLALCTHILAQSDPQVRTSAPLPRHTKLSQNSQQSGKPKRKFSSSWAHHQLSGQTAHSYSGQRRRCTSRGSLPLQHTSAFMPLPPATTVVQRAGSSLVRTCVTTLRSTLTGLCRELRLVALQKILTGCSSLAAVAGHQLCPGTD